MPKEAAHLAIFSFIITWINIVCICLMIVVVLLIKKVTPIIPDDEISKYASHSFAMVRLNLRFCFILQLNCGVRT
jgi:hypothetical protein